MIPRFPPDLRPSPLLLNQMSHTFRQNNRILSFFERFTEDNLNFYVHSLFHPLECWKTQKTASNLVSYFLCTDPKFKITQMPSPKKPTLIFEWNFCFRTSKSQSHSHAWRRQ